jgi:hypothetical protein
MELLQSYIDAYPSGDFILRAWLVLGWIMTVDRLIRESDEQRYCPWVLIDGSWHCLDPVEANDAWWASAESLDK